MHRRTSYFFLMASAALALVWGGNAMAYLSPLNPDAVSAGVISSTVDDPNYVVAPGSVPDYLSTPNWAFSPPLRKFVDSLPPLGCAQANDLGQCIPVAVPDTTTYPGSDYYEIELVQFTEQMHKDLANPTTLRGYRQVNAGTDLAPGTLPSEMLCGSDRHACSAADNTLAPTGAAHFLGPIIVSQKDRPVRVKFINSLPTGSGGDLFIPVDETMMGSGPFTVDYDPVTKQPKPLTSGKFTENRGLLHLHGGRTPWISDGTPHQWITPAGEVTDYPTGVSMQNVPDMPDPGPGANTYYWTNQQSSRMMFYHDHALGITRLNVYVGEAAGYLIRDDVEKQLVESGVIPGTKADGTAVMGGEIPLVLMDKTFVDASTIQTTDPTWRWGTGPVIGQVQESGDSK